MSSSHYHAVKSVPLEMDELRLVERLTLPGSAEHKALGKVIGEVSDQLTEKEALAILVRLGAETVNRELGDSK
ncbi:hypothetical protein [Corynebacterium phocae]|uniref:hypothetical protein n=1 Tax=Corynebacterium phocae TaxID=161895 RepID=UPI001239529C|nr:hypothetical protein [Corynebacterium phocae]KAA8723336.1 hypothetical protein F4V58_08465 [Corynebacterium phocae]